MSFFGKIKRQVIRYLFTIESFAKNMESPGNGIFGLMATKLMTQANNRSIKDAIRRLEVTKGDHFLEIGAGNGYGLQCAKKCDPGRLVGVEISARFRDIIKSHNISGLELFNNDAVDMGIFVPTNSVDAMLAMNVVYFLDPLRMYAVELKRVLKPGTGRGILGVKPKSIETANNEVFRNKSVSDIKKILEEAGLSVEDEFVDLGNPVESYVAIHIRNN